MMYLDFKNKNTGMKVRRLFRLANKGEWSPLVYNLNNINNYILNLDIEYN